MKIYFVFVMAFVVSCWAVPKPMESATNYNVLLIHGAYGSNKGFINETDEEKIQEAYYATKPLDNGAQIGRYNETEDTDPHRLLYWLGPKIFEESYPTNQKTSRIYQYRSFLNPANSSDSNAVELGDRTWRLPGTLFSKRRAMVEEAQEVKAAIIDPEKPSNNLYGQDALDSMRRNPDLYRQLASRYILIGHSMGGVVSREWIQNSNFYHGEVDKVITLDSPHEGTGALNMQLDLGSYINDELAWGSYLWAGFEGATTTLAAYALMSAANKYNFMAKATAISSFSWTLLTALTNAIVPYFVVKDLQHYSKNDPLVEYVDPTKKGRGHIDYLKHIEPHDSLPMFRLLGGDSSITFTDPYSKVTDWVGLLVPEAYITGFSNFFSQWYEGDDLEFWDKFTLASKASTLGFMAHVSARDQGTNLVSKHSGWALGTKSLTNPMVDVKRYRFNAAPESDNEGWRKAAAITEATAFACVAIDVALSWFQATATAANYAAIIGSAALLANITGSLLTEGFIDEITNSHNLPIWASTQESLHAESSSYSRIKAGDTSWSPYLMENFLYERPFVNLALNDSRTMGMLANDPKLNSNCYFESDSLQKVPLCEVGLYGSRDSVVIDPVTMKETHIYNAAVAKTDSAGNAVLDSLGNVVYDSVYYGTFEQRKYSEFRNSPLKFKSESDWYKVGVKVDRWERVDGLKPNGDLAPKGVPIRHVERYSVPDIVVTGFIEKYSFVVDDLMPHRMRQIKMTFNSKEEIAWECNVTKAEDDPTACAVYTRKVGDSWGDPDTIVAHPIKKNGRFDFDASKYFSNLANIQKDNQNTVMISMVNKIGLSNTQRFYYLFKATDNMLKTEWPQHDVVLNAVDGFKAYVSALDYQGFRVRSASDAIFFDPLGSPSQVGNTLSMTMVESVGLDSVSAVFASKQKIKVPVEGKYRWVVDAVVNNNDKDSSKTDSYEVHFKVDRTAPAFALTSDAMMNPDSSMFITRFKWVGKDSADHAHGSDIRVMRWTLEKSLDGSPNTFTKVAELPALYDVASNEFAIAWDKVPQDKRDSMENGFYRIAAYAIDYAVPNENAYHAMNDLVDKIFSDPVNVSETEWTNIKSLDLNDTTIYAEFHVDHSAPLFSFRETRAVATADTVNNGTFVNLSSKYDTLRRNAPTREKDWTYISKDSLLQIGYTVVDTLNGRDSAAVTIGWNFVHLLDTNVIDRAGDSVWVFKSLNGRASGSWTEMTGLRIADGEYLVHAVLRDEAKNIRHDTVPKYVRVDRTAPQIVGLTSDHLVYMDKDGDFSATILVSEKGDIGINRTGMHCSYRVLGGADSSWHEIYKGNRKLLANDTVNFTIAKTSVDTSQTARGLRYLEAACVDAAGNVSVRTDLFHVGARFPQITYPQPDSIQSGQKYIPIVGVAPKTNSADSLSSVYRLRYRVGDDTTWMTDKIKVVAANRSENVDNISRISQSTEGVLGYFENDSQNDERMITVELAIASCETCDDWTSVTTNFVVTLPDSNYSKPSVEFAITRDGNTVEKFDVGDGPIDISVRLKNKFNSNYMLRVYAENSKHRGIFDVSNERVFYNPYYGTPADTVKDTGIWFYELDGKYYLKWKGLNEINLNVAYNSAKFGETCKGVAENMDVGCATDRSLINFGSIIDASKAYLADYPEWMPPAYIDSVMKISRASGEIVMEADEAFRVYVDRKNPLDSSVLNIPVYFGESSQAGFYWRAGVDTTISPLMTGWTVNPDAYGLDYRWNGTATSGAYPSGDITLYAEVTENILDNPFVTVVSKTLKVEQKEAELVFASTLPDYFTLIEVDPAKVASDSDHAVFMRDSMKIYFGLKNGDAHVQIDILNSDSVIAFILDKTLNAHVGDSAYSVTWDGKNKSGMAQSEGTYYVRFILYSDSTKKNEIQVETIPFKLKLRNGLPDVTPEDPKDPSQFGFYVAEAKKKADGRYVYEPNADFIVSTNMSGWYLPDFLRNRKYNVTGNVKGSQEIFGFRPERFSLGIKRHRDMLKMIVVVKIYNEMVRRDNCFWGGCKDVRAKKNKFYVNEVLFTEKNRTFTKNFDFGYDSMGVEFPKNSYIDVVACSNKKWTELFDPNKKEEMDSTFFEELKAKCEWNIGKILESNNKNFILPDPGRCAEPKEEILKEHFPDTLFKMAAMYCNNPSIASKKAWMENPEKVQYIDSCLAEFLCPNIDLEEKEFLSNDKDVLCETDTTKEGFLNKVCDKSDAVYDPNLRLFDVIFTPGANKRYFDKWGFINSYHNIDYYWTAIKFSMTLSIPQSYWNAPFGMDNLVNRTIRFDHTNETIFNGNNNYGYWNAVRGNGENKSPVDPNVTNYFDGNKWQFNPKYGLLTPFEVQRLLFYQVDAYSEGSNVFLFDDEGIVNGKVFEYPSSFELKFYGHDNSTHHFEAKVIGDLVDPSSADNCETDVSKFVMLPGTNNPCQVKLTSDLGDSVKTPVFTSGNVHFFVGMNRLWSSADKGHRTEISYPADLLTWRNSINDTCSESATYDFFKKMAEGDKSTVCYKYYSSGSKVHYYFNDYNDDWWKSYFITNDSNHYFKNYVNSPGYYYSPKFFDSVLTVNKAALGEKDFSLSFTIDPENYQRIGNLDSVRFFIPLDTLKKIKEEYAGAKISILQMNVDTLALDSSAVYNRDSMMLYINAQKWNDALVYRRSNDSLKKVLERPGDSLSIRDIYTYRANPDANSCSYALYCVDILHPQAELIRNPWIKDPVVESSSLLQIDFSEHPLLEISGNRDSIDRKITFKNAVVPRPAEFVEIRGNLIPGQTYSLSFLNNSTYYSISDSIKIDSSFKYSDGSYHLTWFNVNRLQGHTQFLLTWGGDSPTNAMHFDMYIGSNIQKNNKGIVKSMYGDLSVTFPEGSLDADYDFTVRTVNVHKDYGFGVFKNMALTGPVMEVLPSMTFNDTNNLPRIQMKISRQEMENMHVTPQTLRLYKVDFDRQEYVPLEKVLYGFLDANGSAVMNGSDTLKCSVTNESNPRCTDEKLQWEYVLVSAETRTFSVFVAMDTLAVSMPRIGLEILPVIAKDSDREVRVDGVNDFNLYVDDDSLWNDEGDLTPMIPLSFTLDMNGVAHVTLPVRSGKIDTNYVFAFAKVDSTEMFAPAVEKALTVPALFTCYVPSDSLWLGLDNGYLAYGAGCNHPGKGTLSLYKNNSLIAEIRGEIPDTLKYDGKRFIGGSVVGTIDYGRYETRYLGKSVLGENLQLAGPSVRTDSARPEISSFDVTESADVLDRIFVVSANVKDVESGVANVLVTPKFGNVFLTPVHLLPDSLGNVSGQIHMTRKDLAKCGGCEFSLEMRVEDYGHNHAEKRSEPVILYPYPAQLALWYPSREGSGRVVYEYVGTNHHLNLNNVASPWQSDEGVYFSKFTDFATGVGLVNFETSKSYSFEVRIKNGNVPNSDWLRVLDFKGVGGLEIELNVRNRELQLREGSHVWSTESNVLPVAKEWAHVVVTVDSSEVRFYVNGELVKSKAAESLERKLNGVFSVGTNNGNSFIGNISDVRMYKSALSSEEVLALSLPISDDGEIVEIVTVPMVTVDGGNGFEPEFSCSVAGNRYFESVQNGAKLTMDAHVKKAGKYKVMMYVRSASQTYANVAILPSSEMRYKGSISLSPVWRTVVVSDVSMNLSAGLHTITFEASEGVQIAGFALVTDNVPSSSIVWNSGVDSIERKVKTYVKYVGFDDKKILQPRVRLKNISNTQINGYSVRYYFRGEESSMIHAHAYYPLDSIGLGVRSESAHTGYVEWKFENASIPVGSTIFNGDGPHFGVHYEDWTLWNPYDDPSFVENAITDFIEDNGIIVLDADKRLIGGSCVEMEDPVSAEVKARVYAVETRSDRAIESTRLLSLL